MQLILIPVSSFYHPLFFQCYGTHRDLHSFPTRRSSDLAQIVAAHSQSDAASLESQRVNLRTAGRLLTLRLHGKADRKSTRLNSSHANISYAVFCLKKKKKKKKKYNRNKQRLPKKSQIKF